MSQTGDRPGFLSDTLLPGSVRIGGMDKRELLQALREHDVQLNQAAEALFEDRRFSPPRENKVIEIAFVSVADLGMGKERPMSD